MNLTVSIVVLSTVTLVVACGDGSEPTLDEYFAELETAVDGFIADSDDVAIEHGFLVDFDNVPGTVAGFQAFLPAMIEATEKFAAELESLRPPEAATESHADAVSALDDFVAAASTALEEMPRILTSGGLSDAYDRYAEAGGHFSQACQALQQVADAHGVEADLRCSS